MNSLQIELDKINQQLELLTYRKNQLDSIMGEYSDVINRVKNLVLSMEDANVEPSNLLMEIETLIYCPEPEPVAPEPDSNHEKINSYIIPFDPVLHGDSEPEPEPTPEPTAEPQQHFDFDLRLFPKTNSLGLPVATPEPTPENDDDNDCDTDGLDDEDYGFDDDEIEELETEPEQRGNSLLFQPNIYWDNGSSMRVFIPKKRRYKGELEAIVKDCIEQGLAERYDLNECGTDWIIGLAPVTSEDTVKRIIGEFYPVHTDGEPTPTPEETPTPTPEPTPKSSNPELLKLMALVPTVAVPTSTPEGLPKTQLNQRAWRRGDTLLIGFTNKKLMNSWAKWARESWADRINITNYEKLENFEYCLSILWHSKADWERLKALDYSLKSDEQQPIKTDDFSYQTANDKTWQIFRDGVLLGLAKDCDSHWESPQFKGEQFESREAVAEKLWELINNF